MASHESSSAPRKITLGWVLGWIFGVFFFVPGVMLLFQQPLPGLAMLLAAIILLPPALHLIQKKWNFHLSGGLKFVLILVFLGIAGGTIDRAEIEEMNGSAAQQPGSAQQAVATQKSYVPVFTFKGNGIKKSEPFTITGSKFRVKYDCNGQLCQAWLKSPNNAFKMDIIMNTTGSTKDESIFYSAGTYYIEANTLGTYSMTVEDYR